MDAEFIRDLFASFRPVEVRRLFRGAGLYVDGVMFALLSSQGVLYLKADENNEPDFMREGLPPFEYERNGIKRAMKSYRKMPDRLYDDPDELAQWASRALAAAVRKSAPRQKTFKRAGPAKAKNAAETKTVTPKRGIGSMSASKPSASGKATRTTKARRLTKR
jgi:DNA transformation protein